ncbi:hypothetical protein [Paludisphaera rhizosphaerae]|uniref:hypothetical protein n=1 Tax=Paludisphaera rhizosphaerae TaxID=2711216 RepID=UPI0013ED95A7|nr:hypothetical protein [Paludisphaera rhizosphaerae]
MRTPLSILWRLVGSTLATAGVVCFAISNLTIEGSDAFYVVVGPLEIVLPDSGLLGDQGTFCGLVELTGLSLMFSGFVALVLPALPEKGMRQAAGFYVGVGLAGALFFWPMLIRW